VKDNKERKIAMLRVETLTEWANRNGYNILNISRDLKQARVDKVPSEWFAPQWVELPFNIAIEGSWLFNGDGLLVDPPHVQ